MNICQHIWSPKYISISHCEPRSPRVCEGPNQHLPLSCVSKGRMESWARDRARRRCPPLSWPQGCSQPILPHCHLVRGWGLHFTSHSWGQEPRSHPLLRGGITEALPVRPEDLSVGSIPKEAMWSLHAFHSAFRMPIGPPSSAQGGFCSFLLFLPSDPFPSSSLPPSWLF